MSIINDALKKTQSDREKRLGKPSAPQASTATPPTTPSLDPSTVKAIATQKDIEAHTPEVQEKPDSRRILILGVAGIIIIFSLVFDSIMRKAVLPPKDIAIIEKQALSSSPKVAEYKTPFIDVKKTSAPRRKLELMPFKNTQPVDELTLNGIVYSEGGRPSVALINNEMYEVGESVNGKKITAITRKEVTLDDNGSPLILKLRNYGRNGQ